MGIDPVLFGVEGRDRSWNRYAQTFLTANAVSLSSVDVQARFVAEADEVRLVLRPGGTVGAVPLFSPITQKPVGALVISPRFGWSGIGPALQQVGWSAAPELLNLPAAPGSAREVPPWVLAGPIVRRLAALLHQDRRVFREVVDTRSTPRGQILWDHYISRNLSTGSPHHLPCRYSDLTADIELRAYVRWGLETLRQSLLPWQSIDPLCRELLERTACLMTVVGDVHARLPDRAAIDRLAKLSIFSGEELRFGLEALGWLVDERGLAGSAEPDGLAWRLVMHELFERWVERLVGLWAKGFGGILRTGRQHSTLIPIRWRHGATRSLSHLIPDFTVQQDARMWIIDAKYKGHFEELDEARWQQMRDELREAHRHDLHQILAYAAPHASKRLTCVLAYPMRKAMWERLTLTGSDVSLAIIETEGREVTLALVGIPLDLADPNDLSRFLSVWNREFLAAA